MQSLQDNIILNAQLVTESNGQLFLDQPRILWRNTHSVESHKKTLVFGLGSGPVRKTTFMFAD